jgi:hypothetical protein
VLFASDQTRSAENFVPLAAWGRCIKTAVRRDVRRLLITSVNQATVNMVSIVSHELSHKCSSGPAR